EVDPFSKIESFSDSHIHIDEWWRGEVIATLRKIDTVEMVVAINVRRGCDKCGAVVKSALRTKNTAEAQLPRKLDKTVGKKGVIHRQIGWSPIQVRTIIKNTSLGDRISVTGGERSVGVGLSCYSVRDQGCVSHETIGRAVASCEPGAEAGL